MLAEEQRITYGSEGERVDLDTERRNILLLEFSCQVTLDKGRLRLGSLVICYRVGMQPLSTAQPAQWPSCYRERSRIWRRTFPVPPSPTSTSLKVGTLPAASAMLLSVVAGMLFVWETGNAQMLEEQKC